ncbi:uncharacterized protein B0P05DRAFT_492360 [Gilbertella persicaria]|uniref:uncharacterized protein n=1 Tax=Gilbertella persicaria TaxID=101096 RepID=UPI00222002B8|nr:uncharacterized protein B0P05DRAFT_492360 [Gilbertella persicaria]KAI8077351.1 hypothetical protein B0P05DRAFT_492360 [Gilbertella persicaria]
MRSWRTFTIIAIVLFIGLNIVYWRSYVCTDSRFCRVEDLSKEDVPEHYPPSQPLPPPPPPPPPPAAGFPPQGPIVQQAPIPEAHLEPHVGINPQPLSKPETHYPDTHVKSSLDLDTIAPTADKATYRLTQQGLKYASQGDLWQFGVVSYNERERKCLLLLD